MSGTIVLVGFHQGAPREIPLGYWNWMAFDIVNAHFRDVATIMRGMTIGMRLLETGSISLEPLVTHRFALADIGAAFATAEAKPDGFVKATDHLLTRPGEGAGQALSRTISGQDSRTVRPLPSYSPDIRLISSLPAAPPVS